MLSKKELEKLQKQLVKNDRGATWVGFRTIVFKSAKHDNKRTRREWKQICKEGK